MNGCNPVCAHELIDDTINDVLRKVIGGVLWSVKKEDEEIHDDVAFSHPIIRNVHFICKTM